MASIAYNHDIFRSVIKWVPINVMTLRLGIPTFCTGANIWKSSVCPMMAAIFSGFIALPGMMFLSPSGALAFRFLALFSALCTMGW